MVMMECGGWGVCVSKDDELATVDLGASAGLFIGNGERVQVCRCPGHVELYR